MPPAEPPFALPVATPRQVAWGLALVLASAFGYALLGLAVKAAVAHLPLAEVVLVRAAGGLALSVVGLRLAGEAWAFRPWPPLLLRGTAGWLALMLSFAAIQRLPLADAVVVNHTSPFFTVAIAALWLGETMGPWRWGALLLAFSGVVAVAGPGVGSAWASTDPWGLALAMGGAASAGLAYVAVKQASAHHGPWAIGVAFGGVATLGSLPWALSLGLVWPPSWVAWAWLGGVVVASTSAQLCYAYGARLIPASSASVVLLFTPLFAALLAWGAWGQDPSFGAGLGALLLLVAGGLLLWEARRSGA